MKKTLRVLMTSVIGAALVSVTSTVISSGPVLQAAPASRVLRIGHDREVASNVDPHTFQGQPINYLENIYESLAYPFRDTFEIRPVLAESYTVSRDGRTATFKLRRDVRFHDGSALDAEAVKLSFERVMQLKQALSQDELNRSVETIRTPDAQTVVFEIKPGGVPFLAAQTGVLIVSGKALKENRTNDDPWATRFFAQSAVGTGPYRLAELRPKESMRITRFANYWGRWQSNQVDEAVWLQIPEGASQALMLEKGDLDVSFIVPLETVPNLARNPKLQVVQGRGNYVFYLRMNTHEGPLTNDKLRQAFAHAFDYDAYIKARGDYFPPEGPVPSQFLGGWKPNLPKYDIELAKRLYAEAGYGPGKPLKIDQVVVVGADYQRTAAEILQQGLRQLGVEYTISPNQFAPVYQGLLRWLRDGDKRGYRDMFTLRMPSTVPDPVAYLLAYRTGRDLNMMGYSNGEVDHLIDSALLAPDPRARLELYKRAVTKIVEEQPDIWLGVERRVVVMNEAVKGFPMHPLWWPALRVYPLQLRR
ncbi:MAG: ABC transporter substrate-binding protein [Armatimonadota bacterium]